MAEPAAAIVRERAAQAREALDDCAANAPWDVDHCKRAIAENEALADLLEAIAGMAASWDQTGLLDEDKAREVVAAAIDAEAAITAGQT